MFRCKLMKRELVKFWVNKKLNVIKNFYLYIYDNQEMVY